MDTPSLESGRSTLQPSRDLLIGQKLAFAGASLTLGVCSFISLMGMEKSILAIIFGVLALQAGPVTMPLRRRAAKVGVVLGICQIVGLVTLAVLYWDRVLRFFEFLERFQA